MFCFTAFCIKFANELDLTSSPLAKLRPTEEGFMLNDCVHYKEARKYSLEEVRVQIPVILASISSSSALASMSTSGTKLVYCVTQGSHTGCRLHIEKDEDGALYLSLEAPDSVNIE